MEGADCLRHINLNSERMKILLKMVIERKDLARKALYREQLDSEFQTYRMVSNIVWLKQYLCNYNSWTSCNSAASLWDIFQFLMTLSGVFRMEPLYLADICDLYDFLIKTEQNKEPDP